jgi:hypothetical protein
MIVLVFLRAFHAVELLFQGFRALTFGFEAYVYHLKIAVAVAHGHFLQLE